MWSRQFLLLLVFLIHSQPIWYTLQRDVSLLGGVARYVNHPNNSSNTKDIVDQPAGYVTVITSKT